VFDEQLSKLLKLKQAQDDSKYLRKEFVYQTIRNKIKGHDGVNLYFAVRQIINKFFESVPLQGVAQGG
jgi:hypothetical protein